MPTAADYIQDGLVGVYDIVWNLGPDEHDDSGIVYEWFSGQASRGFVGRLFEKNSETMDSLSSSYKIIQFCFRGYRSYSDPSSSIKYFLGSNSAAGFSIQSRLTSAPVHFIYQYMDGKDGKSDVVGEEFFATLTFIRDGEAMRYYRGDVQKFEKTVTAMPYTITHLSVPAPSDYFIVSPYRLSVYNRPLSDSEIENNVVIDYMRFGL